MKKLSPDKSTDEIKEIVIEGIPASPGIAIGPVFLYTEPTYTPELRLVHKKKINSEIKRFQEAVDASKNYLQKILDETEKNYGKEFTEIIETQVSILEDTIFLQEVVQLIQDKRYDAAYATFKVFRKKKDHFLQLADEYFRDRAADIQNLKRLILKHLLGHSSELPIKEGAIIVAEDLSPSDTIKLHHQKILGFCTNFGGKNSHSAIIARSLGVPAVVGTEFITSAIHPRETIILDGSSGKVILNPTPETIKKYQRKQQQFITLEQNYRRLAKQPAITSDGVRIDIVANIEFLEELPLVEESGAEGIGLFRTEGLFMGENGLPTEDEQTETYQAVAEKLAPRPVVIRTLDVGGDKILPDLVNVPERNPFLGWRAIRFCLDHKEIFIPQLKAILRANTHANLHLMLPMVSSLEEIHQFRTVLKEAEEILKQEGKAYNPNIKIGTMIEIPSAAILAEQLAREVDFFSIGTNDLIQYTLAVDRANERISHLYNHFHPAVLQLVHHVIQVGLRNNVPVSMCGEMAADPVAVPILIGMGLKKFSTNLQAIPQIKELIRHVSVNKSTDLFKRSQSLFTAKEIQDLCEDYYSSIFTVRLNNGNHTLS
ncbi:MAG: phosphoenolpyruvate--protein phosphotransferase [Calditrichia bacterium]